MAVVTEANIPEEALNSEEKEGITYYYFASLPDSRASELQVAWPKLLPALRECGVTSWSLNLTNSALTASITKYHSTDYRAYNLLELFALTDVPPSLAIKLALNDVINYSLIRIGLQEDGFAWKYRIGEKRYAERRERFKNDELLALNLLPTVIFILENTLIVVVTKSTLLSSFGLIKNMVEGCILSRPIFGVYIMGVAGYMSFMYM